MNIHLVFFCLFLLNVITSGQKEFPPYDGWYNNKNNPSSGVRDASLTRSLTSHYRDGVYAPSGWDRPPPRVISRALTSGKEDQTSLDMKTALFVYFGQHVINEIVDVERNGCPPERYGIDISSDDTDLNPNGLSDFQMPYERSRYDTSNTGYSPNRARDQINEVTSFLDGGSIYGNSWMWANQLRTLDRCQNDHDNIDEKRRKKRSDDDDDDDVGGYDDNCRLGELLSADDKGEFPMYNTIGLPIHNPAVPATHKLESAERFFVTGSRLANENPFLLSISVIWFRYHNKLAKRVRKEHPDWKVFDEARARNIAVYQNIAMYEWLPVLLGEQLPDYQGYNSGVTVAISNVFESAAMRYLHTTVPPGGKVRSDKPGECSFSEPSIRLCQSYWRSEELLKERSLESFLLGMCMQLAEKEDNVVVQDLRNSYHGPLEFSRRDLVSLSIQTGRDHGLPDYNTALEEFGFNRTKFEGNPLREQVLQIHQSTSFDNIDILIGGLIESANQSGTTIPPLFARIIKDQFVKIRDGDRFWFENEKNGLFDAATIREIRNTTFRDVMLDVMGQKYVDDIQQNPFQWSATAACDKPTQIFVNDLESCSPLEIYDYFESSQVSFIVVWTAVGLLCLVVIFLVWLIAKFIRRKRKFTARGKIRRQDATAREVLGSKKRKVKVTLQNRGVILVKWSQGKREIDITNNRKVEVWSSSDDDMRLLLVRFGRESYDLVLKFADQSARDQFSQSLVGFCTEGGFNLVQHEPKSKNNLMKIAVTVETRNERLQTFFQIALKTKLGEDNSNYQELTPDLAQAKLNKSEVAELFRIPVNSSFLDKIFEHSNLTDGSMTYELFCQFLAIFSKESTYQPRHKERFLFDLYDVRKEERLTAKEFAAMIKSIMTISNAEKLADVPIDDVIERMMTSYCKTPIAWFTFDHFSDFMSMFGVHFAESHLIPTADLKYSHNNNNNNNHFSPSRNGSKDSQSERNDDEYQRRRMSDCRTGDHVTVKATSVGRFTRRYRTFCRLAENYCTHVFWLSLYTLITVGLFANAYYAVVSNKTSGLTGMAGAPLAIARASAGALQFNFSTILLTVCWNIITFLRGTWVARFVPFDAAMTMHKIAAWMGLFFSVMHTVAHGINFYSIPTQSPSDMTCYFSDLWWPSNFIPSFLFWAFQTITGVTGVILCVILLMMYIFAMEFARKVVYQIFHWTHIVGIVLLYLFTVLHGSAMLVQKPGFYKYFLGPACLYTLDKMYSLCRRKTPVRILNAKLLPSNVLYLEIQRPRDFNYKSGQWLQIACPKISRNDYHPFTISSAPNETVLMLHIRSVGPWTRRLCKVYDPGTLNGSPYPEIYLDGPFGEGHQDWYKQKVSVFVGGGIGVTPFASILKDLVYITTKGPAVPCKRVYFLWLARDQKQFEWLMDIIEKVENEDKKEILRTHIFITQLPDKYDLRTTMMYACETHFHKTEGRSMFTGLKAVTHFGRPNWELFLAKLQTEHKDVRKIGVFSCGPMSLSKQVDDTCWKLSKKRKPIFLHHYENF